MGYLSPGKCNLLRIENVYNFTECTDTILRVFTFTKHELSALVLAKNFASSIAFQGLAAGLSGLDFLSSLIRPTEYRYLTRRTLVELDLRLRCILNVPSPQHASEAIKRHVIGLQLDVPRSRQWRTVH
jgi:hypothetical protein